MASDKFFSDEYLDQLNPQQQEEQGPVTVFGLTFKNDEERRQYFRDELRSKLPELRKIEGFPIGEDDDIINLSDPPYYTACPNPWLNDFIKEWEEEKKQLQLEGKRKADFEVKEPYASDVSEGKNNPIYNAHSYHTKVPHPAIMRYILHYTQPGDIVFDGFAGTGMTGVAAQMCAKPDYELKTKIEKETENLGHKKVVWGKRHAILGDLSPVASFIAYNYNTPLDAQKMEKEVKRVLAEVENECGWMYETHHTDGSIGKINYVVWSDVFICPDCGGEIVFYDAAVDKANAMVHDVFPCPHCGAKHTKTSVNRSVVTLFDKALDETIQQSKTLPVLIQYTDSRGKRFEKKPDLDDLALIKKINNTKIPYWFPMDALPNGFNTKQPITSHKYTNVHHFYTNRTLWILASIWGKLSMRSRITLSNCLSRNATRLNRYVVNSHNPNGRINGPLSGTLYIPSETVEQNVFKLVSEKGIMDSEINNTISINSATHIPLSDNSIDYIFTDPPFGANIMYSELNFIQESWLKVKTNNKEEAIENDVQEKSLFDYGAIMQRSFSEYYRVLKPGKWMTVEFSNTRASVWNSIQLALQQAGFIVSSVAALDKKHGGIKSMTYTTAVKQDLVITCYKPSLELPSNNSFQPIQKDNIWDFIQEHLAHLAVHVVKDNKTTTIIERSPKILFDRLISFYVQKGYAIPMDAQEFQQGLRERYVERDGMFFTAAQAAEYEEKKLKAPEFVPMGIIVSDEANGIEWLKNELRNNPQTRQDIYTKWRMAVAGVRKGDIIPELDVLLEENFIQNDDGTWRLANVNDDVDLEKLRTKALLKEFKLYLEVCRKPRGKLKDVRVEAVRAGFKQCYSDKNFADIILVGDRIPQNLLTEDEVLLQYYDIASSKV